MKKIKTIELIFFGIFLISLVGAVNLYSGESYSFASEEFEYYTITGNSSNLDGMNISWESGNITISFSKYFASDSFSVIFFNVEKEIIHEYHSGGGGTTEVYVENKTYVDNYIDKIIYQENETEIDALKYRIKKLDKDLERERLLNDYSRIVIGLMLLALLVIAGNFLKRKKKK